MITPATGNTGTGHRLKEPHAATDTTIVDRRREPQQDAVALAPKQ
jgi:hypothetical protein